MCDSESASCGAPCGDTPVLLGARLVCGGGCGSPADSCTCASGSRSSSSRNWGSCTGTPACRCGRCSGSRSCSDSSSRSCSDSSSRSCSSPRACRVKGLELESCSEPPSSACVSELPSGVDVVVGRERRRTPGGAAYGFRALVCPVKDLRPLNSPCEAFVRFWVRRKNAVVTLQWEGFRGRLGASGICFVAVAQTLCNLPPVDLSFPVRVLLKGRPREGHFWVAAARAPRSDQLRFYLGAEGCENDSLEIPGSAVSWITE